ncbi:ABC transporter ATP-binding protein [Pantoea sp. CCBC3-3-1]|uniref:dipeptide ABC transporter ATP-binding protein n=1 Tax=Pantoea sp. CCBC3-3-1 TaxID=2490851 RepID=UPI0011BE5FAC|nr:ABC transporter ATP-binding protein [Pantoea sp. CCBC3-3-1]
MNTAVLQLQNVNIRYHSDSGQKRVVHNVSFAVNRGEFVALVGESGSGKTTVAQAIIGLLAPNGERESGQIILNGSDISDWSQKRLNALRGARISLIPQDPGSSLNPVMTIGDQVAEILHLHLRLSRQQQRQKVIELLTRVGLSYPELRADQYPHQLSGGMKQRVLIAIAIALRPALIIADEPTSALDVTVQKRVLDLIAGLSREYGTAVLFVTHDLAVAAARADRIVVFRAGKIVEQGPTSRVLNSPEDAWTRQLFADAPAFAAPKLASIAPGLALPAIEIGGISKGFSAGRAGRFQALDNVSFSVASGSTHALVGESGSGKTTLARILSGFTQAESGTITLDGIPLAGLRPEALRQLRQKIQLVWQNPFASLDPLQTLYRIIEEPLLNFLSLSKDQRRERVEEIAHRVALPVELLSRKPRELSGGQRQRVAIARALVLRPKILVLDEATSALDVTVQAQIISLLRQLQQEMGLTYLFISHDLATVRQLAHSVSVLRAGKLVDHGPTENVFNRPTSDYTRTLLAAIPTFRHERETV